MSRFAEQPTESGVSATYADICDVMGVHEPPEFFRSISVRPDLLAAFWPLVRRLIENGQLPASVTQLIVTGISAESGCNYCTVTHRRTLESIGVDPRIVEQCLTDPSSAELPPLHAQVLSFALNAARDPNSVQDEDMHRLKELGMSDGELVEVAVIVALTKLMNTWAGTTGIQPQAA